MTENNNNNRTGDDASFNMSFNVLDDQSQLDLNCDSLRDHDLSMMISFGTIQTEGVLKPGDGYGVEGGGATSGVVVTDSDDSCVATPDTLSMIGEEDFEKERKHNRKDYNINTKQQQQQQFSPTPRKRRMSKRRSSFPPPIHELQDLQAQLEELERETTGDGFMMANPTPIAEMALFGNHRTPNNSFAMQHPNNNNKFHHHHQDVYGTPGRFNSMTSTYDSSNDADIPPPPPGGATRSQSIDLCYRMSRLECLMKKTAQSHEALRVIESSNSNARMLRSVGHHQYEHCARQGPSGTNTTNNNASPPSHSLEASLGNMIMLQTACNKGGGTAAATMPFQQYPSVLHPASLRRSTTTGGRINGIGL